MPTAADALKIAVGQCGNWDSSPVQLGDGAGIYAKHGIAVEAVCTQGTGETQQAVISGSADIGIGVGTLGALGAYRQGRADPHHLGQRDRQRRLLVRQGRLAAQDHQGRDRRDHHRLFEQRRVDATAWCSASFASSACKGKPVATGGPAATLTVALSGQVDIGWTSPPLGFDMLDDGRIRIFAARQRCAEPEGPDHPREHRQRQQPEGAARRVRALHARRSARRSTGCIRRIRRRWRPMSRFRKTTLRNATRLRDEFFAKSALDPSTVKGMDGLMTEAVESQIHAARADARGACRIRAGAAEVTALAFPRRAGVDRQRMDAAGKLTRKCLVDHAVALDPALSAERLRHDMNPEMGLAARPVRRHGPRADAIHPQHRGFAARTRRRAFRQSGS